MLQKWTKNVTYFLVGLSFACLLATVIFTPNDLFFFQPSKKKEVSYQKRKEGTKDIWIVKDGIRYHHHVKAPTSTLTVIPREKNLELVENIENMRCWYQEKKFMKDHIAQQRIHYYKAANGMYLYHGHELLSQDLFVAIYDCEGSDIKYEIQPLFLYFKGTAQDSVIQFVDKTPQFHATDFHAVIKEQS